MLNTVCTPRLAYFIHTVIKEGKAGILVTDKRTFLNEANEHLGFGHQGVELLMGTVPALQEACKVQSAALSECPE